MKTKRNMKKIKEMDKNRRRRRTKIASEGRLYYRFAEFLVLLSHSDPICYTFLESSWPGHSHFFIIKLLICTNIASEF